MRSALALGERFGPAQEMPRRLLASLLELPHLEPEVHLAAMALAWRASGGEEEDDLFAAFLERLLDQDVRRVIEALSPTRIRWLVQIGEGEPRVTDWLVRRGRRRRVPADVDIDLQRMRPTRRSRDAEIMGPRPMRDLYGLSSVSSSAERGAVIRLMATRSRARTDDGSWALGNILTSDIMGDLPISSLGAAATLLVDKNRAGLEWWIRRMPDSSFHVQEELF